MTVREVTNAIIKKTGVTIPEEKTCDHLITGSFDTEVTKIVTSFLVTIEVLREAVSRHANLIITHEPTLFLERKSDDPFAEHNPVYREQKRLLEEYHIAIWRFHDLMHAEQKDGIYRGLEKELGWESYVIPDIPGSPTEHFGACYEIPLMSLQELADFLKEKLEMEKIRAVGDPKMKVKRVGILVGGGSQGLGDPLKPLKIMEERSLDVIVCGEIFELLSPPFIRNMQALGYQQAMLILGHERSEEAGMKHLGSWLEPILPGIQVEFVDSGEPFCYL